MRLKLSDRSTHQYRYLIINIFMAEGEGFEPPVPFRVQWFSRPPPSTTRPSLRIRVLARIRALREQTSRHHLPCHPKCKCAVKDQSTQPVKVRIRYRASRPCRGCSLLSFRRDVARLLRAFQPRSRRRCRSTASCQSPPRGRRWRGSRTSRPRTWCSPSSSPLSSLA
jgi:hypothetical protein